MLMSFSPLLADVHDELLGCTAHPQGNRCVRPGGSHKRRNSRPYCPTGTLLSLKGHVNEKAGACSRKTLCQGTASIVSRKNCILLEYQAAVEWLSSGKTAAYGA
jgi:hypothetical protein